MLMRNTSILKVFMERAVGNNIHSHNKGSKVMVDIAKSLILKKKNTVQRLKILSMIRS